jgi:hypothetical protein
MHLRQLMGQIVTQAILKVGVVYQPTPTIKATF